MSDSAVKGIFIVLGALAVYANGIALYNCLDYMTISFLFGSLLSLVALGGFAVGVGYLMCGFKFEEYFPSKRDQIEQLIQANMAVIGASVVLMLILGRFHFTFSGLLGPIVGLGLCVYMIKTIKTL